ncbi:hypothetical protein QQS21_002069 [Conoideocrella luteorostrata]|uniref:Uncharacterized protein n=1 Tax=Conoideocrella luteorostrata TaxID=1105319 RepID=A0AAJ0CZ16_9HYPO|nr:hypothetical protein QQS21_002069 [Conoideocrella luteorostrata]
MLFSKPVLALLGLPLLVAAFGVPGAYERFYFYYAYRLSFLTEYHKGKGLTIANGCPLGKDNTPGDFETFLNHINKDKMDTLKPKIEGLPAVDETTAKALKDAKATGEVILKQTYTKEYSEDYSDLLKKVGNFVRNKVEHPTSVDPEKIEPILAGIRKSVDAVLESRRREAFEKFQPFNMEKSVEPVYSQKKNIDFDGTAKKYGGDAETLQQDWEIFRKKTLKPLPQKDQKAKIAEFKPFGKDVPGGFQPEIKIFQDVDWAATAKKFTADKLEQEWKAFDTKKSKGAFAPFGKPIDEKFAPVQLQDKKIDWAATAKKYEANHGVTPENLQSAWDKHYDGGHKGNIDALGATLDVLCQHAAGPSSSGLHKRNDPCSKVSEMILDVDGETKPVKDETIPLAGEPVKDETTPLADETKPPKGENKPAGESKPHGENKPPGDIKLPGEMKPPTITKEMVAAAEKNSERLFSKLASERGLTEVVNKWSMTLADVRTKLKYERLSPMSAKFSPPKPVSGGQPTVGGVAGVVGGALWVSGMVDAFVNDATKLDRAAAVTAILPVVGCGLKVAADAEKGEFDQMDALMCVYGDALLLSPAWPVGVAIQIVRALRSLYIHPPSRPTFEQLKTAREKAWQKYLDGNLYRYIYSHPNLYGNNNNSFSAKLNSTLAAGALALLSDGTQTMGAALVLVENALGASNSTVDSAESESKSNATRIIDEEFEDAMAKQIVRAQRQVLFNVTESLLKDNEGSLIRAGRNFTQDIVNTLMSKESIQKHTWPIINPRPPGSRIDNEDSVRADFLKIVQRLENTPAMLPNKFDIAYVVGQSKAMKALDPKALVLTDFVNVTAPGLSDFKINEIVLRYTIQVGRLLRGNITEARLPTSFPNGDSNSARELSILTALKIGRVQDESKVAFLDDQYRGYWALLFDGENKKLIHDVTHPYPPPAVENLEGLGYLTAITGLQKAIVESLLQMKEKRRQEQSDWLNKALKDLGKVLEAFGKLGSQKNAQ